MIVHGHTIVDQPEILFNRIAIDTGAYATGILTGLVLSGADREIIQSAPIVAGQSAPIVAGQSAPIAAGQSASPASGDRR